MGFVERIPLDRYSTPKVIGPVQLLGLETPKKQPSSLPNRRLLRRLQQIDQLPKRDQDALIRTIDAFLGKTG